MVRSTPFYHEPFSTESKKLWNPEKELEMVNPDRGYMTCPGYAPSQGRRCRNRINMNSLGFITDIFNKIETIRPDSSVVVPQLRTILELGLCHYHPNQAGTILARWQMHLQEVASQIRKPKPVIPTMPTQTYSEKEVKQERVIEELREQVRKMQDMLNKLQENKGQPGPKKREEPTVKKEEEEEEKLEKERQEKERLENERLEKERLRKERLEKERLEKERLEKEKERKEKEETERKASEEKQRREREDAARNERIRQRAQRRREEEQRDKQEREKKVREEWDSLWTEYQERWEIFKSSPPSEKSVQKAVPWPVKSFSSRDVNYSNVKEFLREAIPRGVNLSSLLRKECIKWHPDRKMISGVLGGIQLTELDQIMVDLICRVVTELLDSV
jgi:hypothetical protein